jgi:hypothetical protein
MVIDGCRWIGNVRGAAPIVVYPGLGHIDLATLNQTDLTASNPGATPARSAKFHHK